jgi:uncharacterized protein (TIGR03066 family)
MVSTGRRTADFAETTMRTLIGIGAVLALACGLATAQDKKDDKKDDKKIDAAKILGKWEPKDPKKGEEFVMEFAKDGKLSVTGTLDGKPQTFGGTYKIDGDKLSFELKVKGADGKVEDLKETITLLKLADDEMEGKDKEGKVEVLKRVKPKPEK